MNSEPRMIQAPIDGPLPTKVARGKIYLGQVSTNAIALTVILANDGRQNSELQIRMIWQGTPTHCLRIIGAMESRWERVQRKGIRS